MGAASALKFAHVQDQVRTVLSIELLAAAQGIDLRGPHKPGKRLRGVHALIRKHVSKLTVDRVLYQDFEIIRKLIDDGSVVAAAEGEV